MNWLVTRRFLFLIVIQIGLSAITTSAQVTSLSGSLASSNDSDVAPVTDTEIVSGADSFINSVSQPPAYDVTGAALQSSSMNPVVLSAVGPAQNQFDIQVKDALRTSTNSVQGAKLSSPQLEGFARNFSSFSGITSSTKLQDAKSGLKNTQLEPETSWRPGQRLSIPPDLADNSSIGSGSMSVSHTTDQKTDRSAGSNGPTLQQVPGGAGSNRLDNEASSPLESNLSASFSGQDTDTQESSIFTDFNNSSFLDTSIFSSHDSSKRSSLSTSNRTKKLHLLNSLKKAEGQEAESLIGKKRTEQKAALKHQISQRPKWHNPILEQMEAPPQ